MDYVNTINPESLPQNKTSKTPFIVITVIVVIILVVYGISVYMMYKRSSGFYQKYKTPDLAGTDRPGGGLASQDVVDARKAAIAAALVAPRRIGLKHTK